MASRPWTQNQINGVPKLKYIVDLRYNYISAADTKRKIICYQNVICISFRMQIAFAYTDLDVNQAILIILLQFIQQY